MKTFLKYVARDILEKYGNNLSDIAVVFPNKRAALFLNESLARLTDHPIWSPSYITISDLFRKHSTLKVGDPIKLVCDLHKTFVACTGIDETLDHFYGWGQLLITDFDDIDKNMAEAEKLFANLSNIHELDDISYLTKEQKALIKKFFIRLLPDMPAGGGQRVVDDAHGVDRALLQQLGQVNGGVHQQLHPHPGEPGVIGQQQFLHQQLEQGVGDADADGAAEGGVGFAEILHRRHRRHGVAGVGHQRPAEVRQADVFPDAVKQRGTQLLLQLAYLHADRRLGVAQLRGGTGHVFQRGHMQKGVQISYLHTRSLPSAYSVPYFFVKSIIKFNKYHKNNSFYRI